LPAILRDFVSRSRLSAMTSDDSIPFGPTLVMGPIVGSVVLVGLDAIVVALVVAADEPEAAPFGTNVADKVKVTSKFAILGGILEGSK